MRLSSLLYLICPACGKPLTVKTVTEKDINFAGEIYQGELLSSCGKIYRIVKGVPVLLNRNGEAPERLDADVSFNRKTWNFIWNQKKASKKSYYKSEEFFFNDVPLEQSIYKDSLVLELGSGSGKYIPFILERGPKLFFSVDIIDKVFELYPKHAARGNIEFIMADIKHLPFTKNTFDVIISSRVLHHVPDMNRRYSEIVSLLKNGASFTSIIYAKNLLMDLSRQFLILTRKISGFYSLPYLSFFPSLILFLLLRYLYLPLEYFSHRKIKLPLKHGMLYWAKFDFFWLWKFPVLDIWLSIPGTRHTSERGLKNMLSKLSVSEYRYRLQYNA